MLHGWTEILPLFIVRWLAVRHCERVISSTIKGDAVHITARPDVLIVAPATQAAAKEGAQG